MNRLRARANRWLIVVFLLVVAIIFFFSTCQGCLVSQFAFHPQSGMQISPDRFEAKIEPITLDTKDEVQISAFYLPRTGSSCALIFFHGNAGNASHRFADAVDLWKMGINVLLVDYRGFGLSSGRPSERGIYLDAQAARDYLTVQRAFPEKHIVVYGRSIGTAAAVDVAQHRNFAGLIVATPLSSGKEMAEEIGLGFFTPFIGNPFDSIGKIQNVRSPVLVIHGTDDEVIPYEQGKTLFDRIRSPKTFVSLQGADHNSFTRTHRDEFQRAVAAFLKRTCPTQATSTGESESNGE